MYSDDLEQLDAGMLLYDALYRWCRDATDETHNWPTTSRENSPPFRSPKTQPARLTSECRRRSAGNRVAAQPALLWE